MKAIQLLFIDELHCIYFPMHYKHQLQLDNKQLVNKWFIEHFIVC